VTVNSRTRCRKPQANTTVSVRVSVPANVRRYSRMIIQLNWNIPLSSKWDNVVGKDALA